MSLVFTRTDRDLAESLFAQIAAETASPDGGVCRPSYGHQETLAWQVIAQAARDLGLHARGDDVNNLVITRDANPLPRPAIWIGSHLDSVPNGGNYDGLVGVVAALLIVAKARETQLSLPIVGAGLRGEESAWFGIPYLGSKALLGKITRRDLDRRRRAITDNDDPSHPTLATCMEQLSVDPSRLFKAPIVTLDHIAEFWELHIEQGPLLVARGKPVGVVTGIRGNVRAANARIRGQPGHSGTTPHDLRDDAVMHFVEIMTKLEARRRMLHELGDDIVFTCGIVGTDPKKHSITTIADEVRLALDVRSLHDRIARDFMMYGESLGIDLGEIVETPGTEISPTIWKRAARACTELDIPHEIMPSGAGHDAAVFAQAGIPSGMIFVRNLNGSHNPNERMETDDFLVGCEVLWRTITGGRA